jgi:subfamily B ATP-binding cassette protein MsbA
LPADRPADRPAEPRLKGLAALRPYLSLLDGQRLWLAAALVLMLGSTAVTLAVPVFAGRLVDVLGGELPRSLTVRALVMLGALLILQLFASFAYTLVSSRLGLRTVARLRNRVYAHLLELPVLFFAGQKAGDISTRVTSDVGSIQYMLTSGLIGLSRAVLTLLAALGMMAAINGRLTAVVLLMIPGTILLVRIFGRRLQKLSRRMYDELGRISSHVQETVGGIRSLKVYNNQNHEYDRFAGMVESYRDAGMQRAWLSAALESGIQLSLWICLVTIVVYGFTLASQGRTTSGELVTFLLLAFRVAVPLSSLTDLFASAQGAIAAAGRLDDLFSIATERTPGAPVPAPQHGAAGLRLENVSFRYGDDRNETVLEDLDLTIEPGQWVGIVGPSGAGKTTLAGLVLGLFPATEGRLLLDGRPYREYELSDLRSRMAFVSQEPVIRDQSLAGNIRFGLGADDQAVRAAAERGGVLEFADALPAGLETECGERGVRLSGGQRQRVALARAFLRDPGLLVLDEPTSALDAASEDRVRRTMKDLMTGRTAVVISHRFSLVRDLDLILVLKGGRIIEQGRHDDLVAQGGLYSHLYGLQQGIGPNSHA